MLCASQVSTISSGPSSVFYGRVGFRDWGDTVENRPMTTSFLFNPEHLSGDVLPWAKLAFLASVAMPAGSQQLVAVVQLYVAAGVALLHPQTRSPLLRLSAPYVALSVAAIWQRIALFPMAPGAHTLHLDWWQTHGNTAYPEDSRDDFLRTHG